ncbi:hypothetical protein [Yeosuana aromativorans]|uniref:hypothetical protein n=1 Tax=Yeosuana aromativorans TaxID=288019 RepID=UPI00166D8D07|nr:hypothetical protein [Yeosuana aromativorans]
MDTILALFQNNTLTKKHLKSGFLNSINTYKFKRTMLHILWAALNFPVLYFCTNVMINMNLTFVWIGTVILYMPCYWLLSSILFDYIIGDDIDNNSII